MVRNFDLIRNIMFKIQEKPPGEPEFYLMMDDERSVVNAHVELLIESDLVKGRKNSSNYEMYDCFYINRLTWKGHEFLDSIKSEEKWKKIKSIIKEGGETLNFFLVQKIAKAISLEETKLF